MSVPDESYSRNVTCALNLISTFLLQCNNYGDINMQDKTKEKPKVIKLEVIISKI